MSQSAIETVKNDIPASDLAARLQQDGAVIVEDLLDGALLGPGRRSEEEGRTDGHQEGEEAEVPQEVRKTHGGGLLCRALRDRGEV